MKYLLDTHALLWALENNKSLKPSIISILLDTENTILVSVASIWEIGIKRKLGKLEAPENLIGIIKLSGFEQINITATDAERASALPLHHNDPFDRMLIAQAQLEQATLITHDKQFKSYDVKIIEA